MLDENSSPALESPLPPAVLRGLGDRSYDKRKAAALEVTALTKSFFEHGSKDRIAGVINLLTQEFVRSRNVHHRKGGLIGIAATAIGLSSEIDKYLHLLIPPVIECFDDPESRVCYYACESLYNIAKVARGSVLKYFNQIFEGLCKLFAHVDIDVKNGANLLDRLIKDIVTEAESFDIETFIPLLQKHIKRTKPYIRQLIVSWIVVLDAVPDINMLDYLPDFLEGLFNMLSDGNREIKQAADNALAEFLREIKQAEVVDFGPMIQILVVQSFSKEKSNRLTSINWLSDFITLGGTRLLMFYSTILPSILHCISDNEQDIRNAAKAANQAFMNLVRTTTEKFELNPLLNTLTLHLLSEHVVTRVTSLQWISMLHEKDANDINKSIGDVLPALLKAISDPADEVVLMNLQVLARFCLNEKEFQRVLHALIHLFMDDRGLLESRGALVIRKLCSLLNCREIFISLAMILNDMSDLEFVGLMVQTLNLIMLTAPELAPLRKSLKEISMTGSSPSDRDMFGTLFRCWCHNPVATFSLCLLSQVYELSACLVHKFAEINISVGFLMQLDKLVQLLESPVFIHLRLQLLEVNTPSQGDLLHSLYGLLMLLPQSQAYKTLSDRLGTISSLHMHMGNMKLSETATAATSSKSPTKNTPSKWNNDKKTVSPDFLNFNELLERFEIIQERHTAFRLGLLQQKSLLSGVAETAHV